MKTLTLLLATVVAMVFCAMGQTVDSVKLKKTATAVCNCLETKDASRVKNENDFQAVFLECMMDNAAADMMEIMASSVDGGNGQAAGEAFGRSLGAELMKMNCPAFVKMSMAMVAGQKRIETKTGMQTITGTVKAVSDADFLSIVIKQDNGREHTLYYFEYASNSENFIENPRLWLGKKLTVGYTESELYRPKLKTFVNIKRLTSISTK